MDTLLNIAKRLLNENYTNMCLGGSLMLKYRGIDLGRDPHDIDLVIHGKDTTFKIPTGMNVVLERKASDGYSDVYSYKGITIDVLVGGDTPEIINGIPCGTVKQLMEAKYNYTLKGLSSAKKHYDDLVKLGFAFPTTVTTPGLPY